MTVKKNEAGNSLLKFTFNPGNRPIRIEVINQQPYFVAKDVCDTLSISNNRDAMSRLDEDEKLMSVLPTSGQNRQMWFVNESGLYNLIFQSRKPEAKAFRKWVTAEVLPAIRQTGSYTAPTAAATPRVQSRREGFKLETLRMLWLIDAHLNHGDQTQVALELGVSLHAVNSVLRGTLRSRRILWACYQRAIDNSKSANDLYSNPQQAIEIFNKSLTGGK